nr:hypothetical protein [Pseudomonas sp. S11A4]
MAVAWRSWCQFFLAVTTFSYSTEVKTRLVLKAYDVIHKGRLEFDAGWTDMAQSLMAIRKTVTAGGRQYTYTAGRNDNTGHADRPGRSSRIAPRTA